MIKIIEGNILNATDSIICHQTNTQGIMGGGLALQIKNKYPKVYEEYRSACIKYLIQGKSLLGEVLFGINTGDGNSIANLFGQERYGRDKRYTDYNALKKSLTEVLEVVTNEYGLLYDSPIAIPYSLGCGLAGGDWKIVYKIIEDVFKDYDKVTIYKFK